MYYSDEIIEEVRSRNDIVDVISTYVKLQKKGSSYFGLCPFHNEKSPSFSVSRQKQMYYCFGCGAGGNVFTFLMEYENYTFVEALKYLADRAGVELPEEEYSREAKERADTRAILLEINKAAAQYYYIQLKSSRGAVGLEYFKKRKLSDETIKAFGLGYSNKYSDDLYRYLKSKGYKDDMIAKAGLISIDEKNGVYDKFWNRVMFPIMDVNSRVIGFGGRVMGDAKPKYLNSPETMIFDKSRNLYGLNRARRTKKPYFLLCEGYMDVISLHQAGFTNAVASLGTALTPGHAALIHRYVQEVYLTYDSDGAGTRAALRAMPILRDAGITAKIIRMEPYKDPDEFIKNLGAEAFEERIASARNVFMYSLEVLEKDYDMNSPEGKTEFMKETARRLTQFEEEIERNNYIEAVAKAYHVGFEELRKLVGKMAVQTGLAKPAERPREIQNNRKNKKEDGILVSQKVLLTWLIESEEIFHQIEKYITPEDFSEGLFRKVAELLSVCTKRRMCPAQNERQVLGQEYETIVCVEGPGYYVLQGVAKMGKNGQKISGDSFLMKTLPGGKEAAILSDGMGSGERALQESGMLVEMLEELLGAGFPVETALSMINTALVMGREEVRFSTVDMSIFDLYNGKCEFVKAGAAVTFLRTKEGMEHIRSESLPLGVIQRQQSEKETRQLESGDVVVMVSDGILDALPSGEQEHLLDLMIGGSLLENPEELANYILDKVLELAAGKAGDDMTVLVAGIWKMCYSR